jgi:hypothetical protein
MQVQTDDQFIGKGRFGDRMFDPFMFQGIGRRQSLAGIDLGRFLYEILGSIVVVRRAYVFLVFWARTD